jgi:hypothetical protein
VVANGHPPFPMFRTLNCTNLSYVYCIWIRRRLNRTAETVKIYNNEEIYRFQIDCKSLRFGFPRALTRRAVFLYFFKFRIFNFRKNIDRMPFPIPLPKPVPVQLTFMSFMLFHSFAGFWYPADNLYFISLYHWYKY